MTQKQKAIEIQIYFEIAMAIGGSLDLQTMLKDSLSAYLRKLSCSTGAVLQLQKKDDGGYFYHNCFSIPRNAENTPVFAAILEQLPNTSSSEQLKAFNGQLPLSASVSDNYFYHIMDLPGFGLLVLVRSGAFLQPQVLLSLRQLNRKLAASCLACLQSEHIEEVNIRLSNEIERRRETEDKLKELLDSLEDQVAERTLELRESRKRYKTLFDNIQDIYFSLSLDGVICEISPSAEHILRYPREKLLGRSLRFLGFSDQIHSQLIEQLQRDGEVSDFSLTLSARNKTEQHFSMNARLINEVGADPARIIGSLRDITRQRQAEKKQRTLEEQLFQSRKMEALGLLAGSVAHDLNNVLSGIVTYPDLLLSVIDEDSELRKPLASILDSGEKAAAIVDDLLTMTRRGVIQKNIVNLNGVINEHLASPEFSRMLKTYDKVVVRKALDPELLNLEGSHFHIKKVLMNLLLNSAEAGADVIEIKTHNTYLEISENPGKATVKEGDYVVLELSDNGPGISPEDQQRIFEPFYTKKVMGQSGTGLGMSVVWGTVEDHNGHITLESEPGKHTTFHLYFPGSREELPSAEAAKPSETYLAGKESVLVVDDCDEQRKIARAILEALNYTVYEAESGEMALEQFSKGYDIILLDMIMDQGMDGLDTYRRIRALNPAQKVIIASGYSETGRVKEALRLGVMRYIRKPYLLNTIGSALQKCLQPS